MVQFKIALGGGYQLGTLPSLSHEVGLDAVDRIREYLNLPSLSLDLIEDTYKGRRSSQLIVPEAIARESGLFKNCHEITVYTPNNDLEQFSIEKFEVERNESTGEILKVKPYYITDNNGYIEFWKNNSFFTKWAYEKGVSIFS
jgi:hypothetical protein